MRANEFVTEMFEPGRKNWEWARLGTDEVSAFFIVGGREYLWQAFTGVSNPTKWEIQFRLIRDSEKDDDDLDLFGTTGTGNSAEVMSTAVDITRAFLKEYGLDRVEEITFNAKEDSRIGLYAKMIKRLLPDWDLYSKKDPYDGMVFTLTDRRAYDKPENKINEVFEPGAGYPLHWDTEFGPEEIHARAYDRQGQYIDIHFVPVRDNIIDIEFSKMDNYELTGKGDEMAIFATVVNAIRRYLKMNQPKIIIFSGKGEGRGGLYQKMINRLAGQFGYQQFDTSKLSPQGQTQLGATGTNVFVLRKSYQPVEEEVLDEMPLPADWDQSQYGPGSSFKQRLAYALERAKKIGTGSSRVATTIEYQGRPTVLKIAKNQKGLAQNSVEADILSDGYASQIGILIPIIDYDEQNREPTWVHTEMATKANEKQLCALMKCKSLMSLVRFGNAIAGKYRNVTAQSFIDELINNGETEQDIEIFTDYANKLADLANSFDVELADFGRAANWGIYNGQPVVIDVGFNSNVMNQYYK
jgi:hypothetical protein